MQVVSLSEYLVSHWFLFNRSSSDREKTCFSDQGTHATVGSLPDIAWHNARSNESLPGVEAADLSAHHYHLLVLVRDLKRRRWLGRGSGNVATLTEQHQFAGRPVLGKNVRRCWLRAEPQWGAAARGMWNITCLPLQLICCFMTLAFIQVGLKN